VIACTEGAKVGKEKPTSLAPNEISLQIKLNLVAVTQGSRGCRTGDG